MNEYFKLLQKDREQNADVLEKASMKGVRKSVVEKYSEKAHFIYELIQNADDVQATKIKFILQNDYLLFVHNGKIKFNVTNPETEEIDKHSNKLGHINAITSIGQSAKVTQEIGKFGVGFKAVFQYTDNPEIYEDNYKFRINRFVVPEKIEQDYPNRKENETLFYFPFKKGEEQTAFNDILEKITILQNPLLFINNLENIEWSIKEEQRGNFTKKVIEEKKIGNISYKNISQYKKENSKEREVENFISFSKEIKKENKLFEYVIVYKLEQQNKISHKNKYPLYCYFPTRENTNLKFIIQAPFELVDNRQSIKQNAWNENLISLLSNLLADSLPILKELNFINDDFFNVLPINEEDFTSTSSFFYPFYQAVLTKLQSSENLLPTKEGGFTNSQNNYLADSERILNLFSSQQLTKLLKLDEANWIFPSLYGTRRKRSNLSDYVYYNLVEKELTPKDIASEISKEFIEIQTDEWLILFYKTFLKNRDAWGVLRNRAIVRTENQKAIVPFDMTGSLQVFLPTKIKSEYPTIKEIFTEDEEALDFLKGLRIHEPDLFSEIEHKIIPRYENKEELDDETLLNHFIQFFNFYKQCPENELYAFISKIKDLEFIKVINEKGTKFTRKANDIYLKTALLSKYFIEYKDEWNFDFSFNDVLLEETQNNEIYWFDEKFYSKIWENNLFADISGFFDNPENEDIFQFLKQLGIEDKPRKKQIDITREYSLYKNLNLTSYYTRRHYIYDYEIEGLKNVISSINLERSLLIWNLFIYNYNINYHFFRGQHKYYYYTEKYESFEAQFLLDLKSYAWLYNKNDETFKPSEILVSDLAEQYETETSQAKEFIRYLNFKEPAQKEWQKEWDENTKKEYLEFYNKYKEVKNYTESDFEKLNQIKLKQELAEAGGEAKPPKKKEKDEVSEDDIFNLEILQNVALKFAHIFKYPLGEIEKIAESFEPNYPYPQTANEIKQGAYEINNLVKKLTKAVEFILTFAPGDKKKIEKINISEIIGYQFNYVFKNTFENENIKTIVDIQENSYIYYYKEYFVDIINNLIDNSIKALKYKGEDSNNELEKIISCKGIIKNKEIVIEFSDNGIGIDDEYKYKIFEIYESKTRDLGGIGMGLYIVKTRIESLNGSINVIENKYKPTGVTFEIKIPLKNNEI